MILIQQGAEAKIYKFLKEGKYFILKQRLEKKYRHPDLDRKLIKKRNAFEFKILSKLQNLEIVPRIFSKTLNSITMEYISDTSLRDLLLNQVNIKDIAIQIAKLISQLHSLNVIHGDLTSSNILFKDKFYLIDFGLSDTSNSNEDKAVDLYVLKKSIASVHSCISKEVRILSEIFSFFLHFVKIIQIK